MEVNYGTRMEVARSVSAPKPFWNSELQGGAFNQGFTYGPAVPGALQQCWTWSAIARSAKGVIYWCWRDEVWGVESDGWLTLRVLAQSHRILSWPKKPAR